VIREAAMVDEPAGLTVSIFGACERGLVREENQDYVACGILDNGVRLDDFEMEVDLALDPDGRGPLVVVCDGMGGGEHGAVASRIAAETVWNEMLAEGAAGERLVFARQLRRAVRAANLAVRGEARRLRTRTMGTTLAAAGVADGALLVALVGDCRAYIFRGHRLTQVTRDQSVVSALVSAGQLSPEEARTSGRRHMVLQALGPGLDVEVSLSVAELRRGDRLLLTSDGAHGVLEDRVIAAALDEHPESELAAIDRLAELARRAGAPDNFSAVLVRFDGEALEPPLADADRPAFTEVDPGQEGEDALYTTSHVARRLAGRAGLRPVEAADLPNTATHAVLTVPLERSARARRRGVGPAERALAARSRIHWAWWLAAAAVAAAIAALLW
jgi:protein phosphatase